jgi:hypothetical protein
MVGHVVVDVVIVKFVDVVASDTAIGADAGRADTYGSTKSQKAAKEARRVMAILIVDESVDRREWIGTDHGSPALNTVLFRV